MPANTSLAPTFAKSAAAAAIISGAAMTNDIRTSHRNPAARNSR
jgi:hypothetical protein